MTTTTSRLEKLSDEERNGIVRRHFERKGYRVHSGLQFGCELVLYADTPERVHSDFCIHVVPADGHLDWQRMQTLTRSMPDLHKTLILAFIRHNNEHNNYQVDELAIATEHAPFRHKNAITRRVQVGTQWKKAKTESSSNETNSSDANNINLLLPIGTDGGENL